MMYKLKKVCYNVLTNILGGISVFKKRSGILQNLALLSQVGIMMLTPIAGGVIIGRWLDDRFGTGHILLFLFLVIGVGSAFRNLYALSVKKSNEYQDEEPIEMYVHRLKEASKHKGEKVDSPENTNESKRIHQEEKVYTNDDKRSDDGNSTM
ncbi:MAG: synthase protein [Clostridiales bacterium]|nr:synthase protein [Clostridiales bacterium]